MPDQAFSEWFSLEGQVAIVTGGTGVLGGAMAMGLAQAGARVAVMGRHIEKAEAVATGINTKVGAGCAMALPADVLSRASLEKARDALLAQWGQIDILVNAAGGNAPAALVTDERAFFEVAETALREVSDLNWLGTILPSQVFGAAMAERKQGCIVNISSMAARRTLTRVMVYSSAKAAIDNLTRWLATELTRKYGPGLRVNAIAPGFFIGEQNRSLLLNPDGSLTARGQKIIEHTPAGRFGEPDELVSTLVWLCGPGARFVNGVVVAVDGGFDVFSGI